MSRTPRTGACASTTAPFHALAEQNRDLVCGLNRKLAQGIANGLGNETLSVKLLPRPNECCVELRP